MLTDDDMSQLTDYTQDDLDFNKINEWLQNQTEKTNYFGWWDFKGTLANSVDPDQTSQKVVSDQGLHHLLTAMRICHSC